MNILFICPTQPVANGAGIQKRAWSHLEALSRLGTVDLVLPLNAGQRERLGPLDAVNDLCRQVHVVRLDQTNGSRSSKIPGLTLVKRWMTFGQPMFIPRDQDEIRKLRDVASRNRYDLVFCFRLRSFTLMPLLFDSSLAGQPRIFVDFDDVESAALERELSTNEKLIGFEQRQIMKLEVMETARHEAMALQHCHGVSVCSELDAHRLRRKGTKARICVVPNSLPRQDTLPLPTEKERTRMLFLGTMTYLPNEDAALYFCHQILPAIRAKTRRVFDLDIVGRGPSPIVRKLDADPHVNVMGGVESVETFYAQADIVLAPIRFGGGTRIKILEALAFGRPVVSTTIGAEGLDLVPGRDILIADTPESFAAACIRLAEDDVLRRNIAQAGRARFQELYESRRVQEKLISDLRQIVELTPPEQLLK